MDNAGEASCTISHHGRWCRLHLGTVTLSCAFRAVHEGRYHSTALRWISSIPPWVPAGVTGTSGRSDWIHIQLCQAGKARAKVLHAHKGREAPDPEKDPVRVEAKPSVSTLKALSYKALKFLMGKKPLTLEANKRPAPHAEIPEYLCLVLLPDFIWQLRSVHKQQQTSATKHVKDWDPNT